MSCDLDIWSGTPRMTHEQAGEHYVRLCEGDVTNVRADPGIAAFYAELAAKHAEIRNRREEALDDGPATAAHATRAQLRWLDEIFAL